MKTKFGNYLEKFMIKNNYTLEYVANQTESSLSVVGHYRKGIRIPKDDFIERFIESFIQNNIEADEIRYIVAYDRTPDLIKKKIEENSKISKMKSIELPILGKAAAGFGHINFEGATSKEIIVSIPNEIVPKNAFLIEVTGESMFPTLNDGDLVIIDSKQKNIEDIHGKVCVFTYHDQTYIKRAKVDNEAIRLTSDNQNKKKYSDIIINGENLEFLKCHGTVIESRRKH